MQIRQMIRCAAWFASLLLLVHAARAQRVTDVAVQLGWSPDGAAVAGVNEVEYRGLLQRLVDAEIERQFLGDLQARGAELTEETRLLFEALRAAPDDLELLARKEALSDSQQSNRLEIDRNLGALREIAGQGLPSDALERHACWIDARLFETPAAFKSVMRLQEDWVALERAVRVERYALRTGEQIPVDISHRLAAARAEVEVVAAAGRIETDRPALERVFADFED